MDKTYTNGSCLRNNAVLQNGKLYEQKKGVAIWEYPKLEKINYTRAYMRKFDESPVANK